MSNAIWPMWGQPARNRVLAALARHPGQFSVREIARLAHVSPSTALRISDALVASGTLERKVLKGKTKAGWPADPRVVLELRKSELPKLKVAFGGFRSKAELLEYLAHLDGPVWVVDRYQLAAHGVTRRIPTFVVLPRSWVGRFKIPPDVPVAIFEHAGPLQRARGDRLPWLELFIALLKIDTLAARQYYEIMPALKPQDRRTLLRRIREEGATDAAAKARISLDHRRS